MNEVLSATDFTRLANNFYQSKNLSVIPERIGLDSELMNYVSTGIQNSLPKFKVAFCWICINPHYWEFAKQMVSGAKQFFLPGHQVDFFLWSDIPREEKEMLQVIENQKHLNPDMNEAESFASLKDLSSFIHSNMTVIPTDQIEWPMPTLMRYHLFLQEETKLSEYDYIFYCDVDMLFVNIVGDEILGDGLTAAVHPGYYIKKELFPPYEPNLESAAYIPRPGKLVNEGGKPRFTPLYYAGGLQGGKSKDFIKAMKAMKLTIDKDFSLNYKAIWNDESHWNRYLFENPPAIVLTPSYIFPDSLIKEYYEPYVWGQSFMPRLVTLTKKFSVSAEGGAAVQRMIQK